jgi:hypothetical protein
VAILVSDKIRYGRIHPANWIGMGFNILTTVLSLYIAGTAWYAAVSLGQ